MLRPTRRRKSRASSREEVFRRLSRRAGGALGEKAGRPAVRIHGPSGVVEVWTRLVSTGQVMVALTVVSARFRSGEDFRMTIRPRHAFHRLAELLGRTGLKTGRKDFDRAFTVRSNHPARARSLLLGSRIVPVLVSHRRWSLDVGPAGRSERRDRGGDLRQLALTRKEAVEDVRELADVAGVGGDLLERLVGLGLARRDGSEGAP